MITTTVTCDRCGKDLTNTVNCQDYYVTVGSSTKVNSTGLATVMHIKPPLDRAYHFCTVTEMCDYFLEEAL